MTDMSSNSSTRSMGRTVAAVLILLIAGYIVLKIVIGIALALAVPVLLILAVVGLVWAWRVLF